MMLRNGNCTWDRRRIYGAGLGLGRMASRHAASVNRRTGSYATAWLTFDGRRWRHTVGCEAADNHGMAVGKA